MEQRAKHRKKPVGKGLDSDVVYNTDGRGARKVKEPGTRWRFEPYRGETSR